VEVGIGRGNQPGEFAGFDVSMNEARERTEEALEIIRAAWTQKRFSYDGRFWQIPEVEVLPKPYQDPHPPLWQAAVSASSVRGIVANGLNGLIGPYLTPFDVLKREFFDVWHEAVRDAGRTDLQMCHNEFIYVGESDAQVKADVEEDVMWYVRKAAALWGHRDRMKAAPQYAHFADVLDYFATVSFDEVYENTCFGTPDKVAEKMRWLRDEGGCDYVMNFMWFGNLPHEKAMRSMELFAREVMPQLDEPGRPDARELVAEA
jgi:alkanesulfonate monooxygenase SsuD/methylene tetrahydromethanopterin reductase-like flavin-dependent oxidoreductase (luciferase family)